MEIVFLGTGTSQGVPMIAYDDHDCDLTNPKNWRTRSSVHVVMDGVHIQVDAAPEFRMQCLWNKIPRVDHFILTHGHSDHMMGMDDLRRFCQILGDRAIPVYSQEIGLERVGHAFAYAMGDKPLHKGYPAFKLELMPSCLELPCGRIYSTVLPHGRFEVLGNCLRRKKQWKTFRLLYRLP
jgi:phosphoribosyl 1,2-cyclic phosphate phosphodiesterase